MTLSKNSRMLQLLNFRLKLRLQDGRTFIGQMIAFDKHMNLVLSDCEEFRKLKKQQANLEVEERRTLGLVILRGETIISMSVEAPPPAPEQRRGVPASASMMAGGNPMMMPGMGRPAGRGMPFAPPGMAPAGLSAPVPGIGGPAPGTMQPSGSHVRPGFPPGMAFGRPPPPGMGMPPGMMPPGMMPPGMMPPGMMPPGMMSPGMMPPPGFRPPPGMPPMAMGRGMPGFPPGFRPPPPGPPPPRH